MSTEPASSVLANYKVLDLTRARAGPTCVKQLADWGAQVIKIEMPEGDGPADISARHGADFQNLHRNKRSLTLDLKSEKGVAIFMQLAAQADVVVENYRPGVKHRLGIDYESVKAVNPRIVYGSISGFGQDGPYANRPGLDPIIQGMGGHMWVTGEPGRGPMRSGAAISDVTAGLLCANAVLMALLEREHSGEGQWVHTSLIESMIFLLDFQAARWTMSQDLPGQVGNNHPTNSPMGVFKTADGYVTIAPTSGMWAKFCAVLGRADLVNDANYAQANSRAENRTALNEQIDSVTVGKSSAQWIEIMNEAGVPCGPICTLAETFADPQVQHLGIAQTVESKTLGPVTLIGQAIHMSRTPNRLVSATAECGEHTDEILAELDYPAEEIARLRADGVL
ncbi:MAG: crotonobetainyl-CoA:carnitine CoA-transferase CaiB-like acyl-CoA transferase [Gammaproteobacteria bacterium]|jgi:crotonobetainyl-CoA:carnitine CoA-transferase CaiB-like acyl-CoA transferase